MKSLTSKQFSILKAIDEMSINYPPTLREIAEKFGITNKGVFDHVRLIELKGFLAINRKVARGLRITDEGLAILGKKKITQIDPSKYMPAKLFERKDKVNVKKQGG